MEYLSEKRQHQQYLQQQQQPPQPQSQPQIQLQQQTQVIQQTQTVQLPSSHQQSINARPVSLILSKGERPTFKLVRTPSIDQQELDDSQTITIENTSTMAEQCNNVQIDNLNSCNSLLKDDNDDYDESVPLVQATEPNKITNTKLEKF